MSEHPPKLLRLYSVETMETTLHGYVECTNEQYHAGLGISKSKLDAIAISPLEYWDRYINPEPAPHDADKDCFKVGDGTHKLILEPGTFEQTYGVAFDKSAFPDALDSGDQLKEACRKEGLMVSGTKADLIARLMNEADYPADRFAEMLKRQHEEKLAGKLLIKADDYRDMLMSIDAMIRHPWAGGLLAGAHTEQSFFWTDEDGLLRKCRTDLITADGEWVGDVKTTDDVSEAGFGRTIIKRRYHVQAAWYLDILNALYGSDAPRGFAFIAAQKKRPYDVAVHWVDDELLELGRRTYQADLAVLRTCLETNIWPGADRGDLLRAMVPTWALRQ